MPDYSVFTSESVGEGHPDKMADQISDAVLDAMLAQDPESRVACETLIKTSIVVVAGEIRSSAKVNIDRLVRQVIRDIGYDDIARGFDPDDCTVVNALGQQSADIAKGVDETDDHEQGAGDQGLMFGYATNETDVLMPAPITYAHRLVQRQAEVRRNGACTFLRPDAKSQLTFRYGEDGKPLGIDAVVLSTQHDPDIYAGRTARSRVRRNHQADDARQLAHAEHEGLHQPNRQVRHRRPGRRLRAHRPQNHRRHVRRHGAPRRRRVFR